jgi:hypothetical protein
MAFIVQILQWPDFSFSLCLRYVYLYYSLVMAYHRLKMELDLPNLFGLHVHSCTHWLRPRNPPAPPPQYPRIWAHIRRRYWSAKTDDISL